MEEVEDLFPDFEEIPVGVIRQRVRNMETSPGNEDEGNPVTETNGAEKHPLDLMLEEIWEKVFEWLTDPKDLANCLNSCSTFNKILRDKRTTFMFSEVFKVLSQTVSLKKSDHVNMLVCRSVCKVWRNAVDNLYQNLPFFSELDYHAFDEEALKCISAFLCRIWNDPFSIDFNLSPRGLPELQEKTNQWNNSRYEKVVNPFPSRHLAIYDSEDTLRDDMEGALANVQVKEDVKDMLKMYGQNVWYFTVLLSMGVPSQRYLLLLEWLKFIPNLKVLSLYFRAGDEGFQETVDAHPFPEMEHLVVLQCDKVPNIVLKSVFKANPQLEKFQSQGAPSLMPFKQPNLAEIKVQCDDIMEIDRNTAKYSCFENISVNFYDATKKATAYNSFTVHSCTIENNGQPFEIQLWKRPGKEKTIFTNLERFESTLVHFKLGILESQLGTRIGKFSFGAVCIDVILPLRAWSLKSLTVSAKCRDGYRWIGENNAITQLFTYLKGRLHESKIWKLPEIKTVFVVDGYEGYLTLFV